MNFEESEDLKEFCANIPLIMLPSTLWSIHIDPEYRYIAIVHIQVRSFSKLVVDKGILLTKSSSARLLKTSFFIQNELIHIPKLTNCITTVTDLSHLIQIMHELKICPNAEQLNCNKYVDFNKYSDFCNLCTEELNLQLVANDVYSPTIDNVPNVAKTEPQFLQSVAESYVCEVCNKTSNSQSTHEKHLQTHLNEKLNLCSVCGKTFSDKYRLKTHLLTHSAERPFECNTCHKVFAKSYNLKLHEKTHAGVRPYVCSVCGKTYTSQSNLTTHVKSVHTKEKRHPCAKCDMTFVHPRHLRLHTLKHTGEKPFSCMICAKSFAKKVHLTIHVRTHTGEKPHLCFCGKGFTTTGNLSAHKRIHHKDEDG